MKKIVIILAVFTWLFIPFTLMAQKDLAPYHKTGPAYLVSDPSGALSVLYVAEYKTANEDSWHYFLQRQSVRVNEELRRKEIAATQGKPLEGAQLIGRLGDIFYVVTDSLAGYDVHTLEPVITEAILIDSNPFIKDNVSRQANNYLLDEAAGVLYVRAENDDRYKLYAGSPILKPDDGNNESAPEDYNYEANANYRLYDRYTIKNALTCIDSGDNRLYILGSEKETGSVISYFGTSIFPEREENRQLTIAPYPADGEKPGYKTNLPKTGKAIYFKGGLLQQKFYSAAWRNKQGDRIILFETNSKTHGLCVALVDKHGNEKWRTETGRASNSFADYLVSEDNLLLWFNTPGKEDNPVKTGMLNVDLLNGEKSN